MAKRVNKNMVVALTAFAFMLMAAGGILMVLQLRQDDPLRFRERAEKRCEQAERYKAEDKWEEAKEEWNAALRLYQRAYSVRNEPLYLVNVGEMFYNLGDENWARQSWEDAVTIDPQLEAGWIKAAEFDHELARRYPSPGRWKRSQETAEKLLEFNQENPSALFYLGSALIGLRAQDAANAETGLEKLRRAVELAPENVDYCLALVRGEAGEDQAEKALARLGEMGEANTVPGHDASRVRSIHADLLTRVTQSKLAKQEVTPAEAAEQFDQAMKLHQEAIELAGEDPKDQADARVHLARHWYRRDLALALRDPDRQAEVDETFEKIKKLLTDPETGVDRGAIGIDPDGFDHYLLLADLYQVKGRHADAVKVCEERIKRGIDRKGLKGARRKHRLYLTLVKAAEACVTQAAKLQPGSEREAILDQAQGFVNDARRELADYPQAIHMAGRVLLAQGKDLEALAQFEAADEAYPGPNWENKSLLASLYFRQGQIGAARQAIEKAVDDSRASTATHLTHARILLRSGEAQKAAEAARKVLLRQPTNREALRLQLEAFRRLGRHDLIELAVRQIDRADPQNALIVAQALATAKRHPEALSALEPVLEADPADLNAVRLAAALYNSLERHQDAQAVVERAMQAKPEDVALQKWALSLEQDLPQEERDRRYLAILNGIDDGYVRAAELAQYYLDLGELDKAEEQLAVAEEHLNKRDTPQARAQLAAHGERALREVMDKRFLLICASADRDKDWRKKAEEIAAEIKAGNIDGVEGLIYFGRLQLLDNTPELAADSFRQALQKQPNNSQTLTFLAQAYLEQEPKRYDQAREAFEQAVAINPHNGLAHKGLAVLAKGRDRDVYQEHLADCKRLIPNDQWVRAELALLEEEQDPEKGIKRRLAKLEAQPDDYQNIVVLARLHLQLEKTAEAQQYYDQALALVPENLAVAGEVSEFYRVRINDKEKALRVLQEAVEANDEAARKAAAHLLIGRHFQAEGATDKADAALLAAADVQESAEVCANIGRHYLSTGRPQTALDWLDKAVKKADEAAKENLARETLVLQVECLASLASLKEEYDYDQALEGVEQLLERHPDSSTALLLRADIEVRQGRVAEAIDYLTRFLERFPDSPKVLFLRASLYQTQLQWGQAIEDLERLKGNRPDALDLRPRLLLATAYDHSGRFDLASSELRSLLEEHPDNIKIADALIRLYVDHDEYEQADRLTTRMLNRWPDQPYWFFQRGYVAIKRDDAARAKADLLVAAQKSDFESKYVAPLMQAYRRFKAYDQGIRFYEQELPVDRRNALLVEQYATLLAAKGRAAEAVEQYRTAALLLPRPDFGFLQTLVRDAVDAFGGAEQALEQFRTPPEGQRAERVNRQILGTILAAADRFSEAQTIFQDLLATAQDDAERAMFSLLLGILADQADNYEQARVHYERVIKLEPDNWVALNNLAYTLSEKLQQPELAKPHARRAAELHDLATVADTYGMVLTSLGKYREAIGVLTQAVRRDPSFVTGYLHQAEAYRRLGEFREAESILIAAQKLIEVGLYLHEEESVQASLERVRNRDRSP